MKRKSHIITRIALAATVFTTTLAGVMPMTALAAGSITFQHNTSTTAADVELTVSDGTNGSVTATTSYGDKADDAWEITYGATSADVTATPNADYELTGWLLNGTTSINSPSGKLTKSQFNDTAGKLTATIQPVFTPIYGVTVAPTTATFDKNSSSSNYKNIDLKVTLTGSGNQIESITDNIGTGRTWTEGTNYTISGDTVTLKKETLAAINSSSVTITVNGKGSSKASTTISITNSPVTPTKPVLSVSPASGSISTGSTLTFAVNPNSSSTTAVPSYIYYTVDGTTPTTSSPRLDYPTSGSTITVDSAWANLTQPITLKAFAVPKDTVNYTQTDALPATTTYTITTITGTATTIKSFEWTTNGAELGNITTNDVSFHDGSKPAVIYEVNGTKTFTNGTSKTAIQTELDKSKVFKVVFKVDDKTHTAEGWKWDYTYTQGESKNFSGYSVDEDDAQTFYVYSEPIEMKTTGSSGKTYSVSGSNFGPANYIRLKLKIEVLKKGDTGTKGSGNVAAPTFSPVSGTVVTPGTKITFSSTTSGVSFRSQSGTVNPTTSSGTAGAQILIPSGASAGEYKLNAIAYTSSSAYSDVASATYTVVTDTSKYTITEGNGQTASSAMPATFTGSGDLGNFKALYVDDVIVPETLYTKSSGSTIITLSPTYLQTLSAGNHTVKIVYSDGYATGNFTLTAGGAATPINEGDYSGGGRASTGTDDKADLVILFVLFGMVLAGFVVSVYYRNEKIRNSRFMD